MPAGGVSAPPATPGGRTTHLGAVLGDLGLVPCVEFDEPNRRGGLAVFAGYIERRALVALKQRLCVGCIRKAEPTCAAAFPNHWPMRAGTVFSDGLVGKQR